MSLYLFSNIDIIRLPPFTGQLQVIITERNFDDLTPLVDAIVRDNFPNYSKISFSHKHYHYQPKPAETIRLYRTIGQIAASITNLEELCFDGFPLTEPSVKALGEHLGKHPSLTSLIFKRNKIGAKCGEEIVKLLPLLPKL